jgi:3-phosphoshikimate 1-carboxyvinyltransferase
MEAVRTVRPLADQVAAVVAVPGSKSIANRALVCAALADGESTLDNAPDGDDTVAMVAGLSALGATIRSVGDRLVVDGTGGHVAAEETPVHAALAGTTSRFLTAVAAIGRAPVTIDGAASLRRRPFGPLHDALRQLGVAVAADDPGHLPAAVTGPPTSGSVSIAGDVSSQYITALMLIGPYLPGGLDLTLTTPLVSRPYVDMTAAVMAGFGVTGVSVADRNVRVPEGRYRAAGFMIEPDASSASYPLAVAAVLGGTVEVVGLGAASLQGDARFGELLAAMGCTLERDERSTRVTRRPGDALHGIDIDMADVSDLVPTVAAVALFADSPTRITGVGFIRGKESDRLGDLSRELRALGGDVDETEDGLVVRPSADRLGGATVATHHDHRLAMAFGVIGSVVPGVTVADSDVVSKSWPGYWTMLEGLAT